MKNSINVERAKLRITQAELAERVNVSRQTIHSIEAGKFVPSTILAMKIAAAFATSVEHLFTLEPKDWQ